MIFNEADINKLLLEQPIDLDILKSISRQENGFINKKLRSKIWPKLLHINRYQCRDYENYIDLHRDYTQVHIDIERSLWKLEDVKDWNNKYREKRRKVLSNIIIAILCKYKQLYYYQGYHDIISTILLTLEDDQLSFLISEALSLNFFSDYMSKDFKIVSKSMHMIMIIIEDNDSKLYNYLQNAQIEPFFSTSWLITWFSHDINSTNQTARLFDALLCSHPCFCYYICAAFVIFIREEVFQCECDFAAIHNLLVRAPSRYDIFPSEELIHKADQLFMNTSIDKLKYLCNKVGDLSEIIKHNSIASISKPYKFIRFINSDWKLFEDMHIKSNDYSSIYSIFPHSKKILEITLNNIVYHNDYDNQKNILSYHAIKNIYLNKFISKSYNIFIKNINMTYMCTIIAVLSGMISYVYVNDKI